MSHRTILEFNENLSWIFKKNIVSKPTYDNWADQEQKNAWNATDFCWNHKKNDAEQMQERFQSIRGNFVRKERASEYGMLGRNNEIKLQRDANKMQHESADWIFVK